eukprot:2458182-Rhodomonas_salina.1
MSTSGRPASSRSSSATDTIRLNRSIVSRGSGSCSPLRNASTCRRHRSSPSLCSTWFAGRASGEFEVGRRATDSKIHTRNVCWIPSPAGKKERTKRKPP